MDFSPADALDFCALRPVQSQGHAQFESYSEVLAVTKLSLPLIAAILVVRTAWTCVVVLQYWGFLLKIVLWRELRQKLESVLCDIIVNI